MYQYKQRKNAIFFISIILGGFLIWLSLDILPALFGSIICYILFRKLHGYLVEKRKWKAGLSAISIIVASFFIIVLPLYYLIVSIIKKTISFYQVITSKSEEVKKTMNFLQEKLSTYINVNDVWQNILKKVEEKGVVYLGNTLSSTLNVLLQVSIMYFLLYYMFAYYKKFEEALEDYLPFESRDSKMIGVELTNITYSNLLGQTIISIVQGLLLGLGFWIFNVSDAWFWGLIGIFVSFLPVIGTPIIFVPAAMVAFANGDTSQGWGILLYGFIIITNIDYPLRLWLGKKMGDIHPIITIIGVIIGIPFFGIIGLVYGPMLISLFILTIKIFKKYNLKDVNQ
jgi:predicted PurR-regulated permease PerM